MKIVPHYQHGGVQIFHGDCLDVLPQLPAASVQCCVTSPPYFGLRDYGTAKWEGGDPKCDHSRPKSTSIALRCDGGTSYDNHAHEPFKNECPRCGACRVDGQIGLEDSLDEYVAKMVEVFQAVWRVLRDDGVLFLNMGDSYNAYNHNRGSSPSISGNNEGKRPLAADRGLTTASLKPKDLLGMPWRVAFALQADRWYLRSDIIWHKPSAMPESVTDRPTKAHEYVFLLTKKAKYFYDADAVREKALETSYRRYEFGFTTSAGKTGDLRNDAAFSAKAIKQKDGQERFRDLNGRNLRDVWTIPSKGYPKAHFATFPPALVEPCIKAGTSEEGCCPECGAPWQRVTEKDRQPTRPARDNVNDPTGMANRDPERHVTTTNTIGWQPTCHCREKEARPVPCTVLDPFHGQRHNCRSRQAERLQVHRNRIE